MIFVSSFIWLILSIPSNTQLDYPDPPPLGATGGWIPQDHQFNWAVGVHRRRDGEFEHICGGSLISRQHVLSAAHCFWNNGREVPLEEYKISAGNFHRRLDEDYHTQQMEVEKIVFHERYRGYELNYAHDIVLVMLTKDVVVNEYVGLIAIDGNPDFEDNDLKGQYGIVIGWGFTENNEPSVTSIAVSLPFVDFDNCYKVVPRNFHSSLTPDKFCAGLRNGTAVCPGDSGGGLAFFRPEENKWYVRGIVSVGVRPKGNSKCHKTQYSAFTSISHYRSWIHRKL